MTITHITSTTVPINGFDIIDPNNRCHVVDGNHSNKLKVYFENYASRLAYLDVPIKQPEQDLR